MMYISYSMYCELVVYAHYTRFVLIVNGCAMAQALVTRAFTHCQRGCTLLQHGKHGKQARQSSSATPTAPRPRFRNFNYSIQHGWLAGKAGKAAPWLIGYGLGCYSSNKEHRPRLPCVIYRGGYQIVCDRVRIRVPPPPKE